MFEDKKQEIEAAFQKAASAAKEFNAALMEMRSVELPSIEGLDTDERNALIQIGRDLDMRTAFILRSLLVQHGNVLWL
jgi:hypothetical protein